MHQSLQNNFLQFYFNHVIHGFYIADQVQTQQTIFNVAGLSEEQQQALWSDATYGWESESTFLVWTKLLFSGDQQGEQEYDNIMLKFDLSDAQMEVLVGRASLPAKLFKLVQHAISDGIASQKLGTCKDVVCTYEEMAMAQWGSGTLTENQLVPPVTFEEGGYANFNESIPSGYEFYLNSDQGIGFEDVQSLLTQDVESSGSLFSFSTEGFIQDNQGSLARVKDKLGVQDSDLAQEIIDYLNDKTTLLNRKHDEQLAQQSWRFMTGMVSQGGKLLTYGLYAKALYYKKYDCQTILKDFKDKVCSNATLDFTRSSGNGMVWVEAALAANNPNTQAFQWLLASIPTSQSALSTFLWDAQNSQFASFITATGQTLSSFYNCAKPKKCSQAELFYLQWGSSQVTQNLPNAELGFTKEDKVWSVSEWDVAQSYKGVYFELSAFLQQQYPEKYFTVTTSDAAKLLGYDMGGLLGYYSLYNLTSHVLSGEPLHAKFPLDDSSAQLVVQYLTSAMVNYHYGGQVLQSDEHSFLFAYSNAYTRHRAAMPVLSGGLPWKNTAAKLLEQDNQDLLRNKTLDDFNYLNTGLKTIDNVRKIQKVLSDKIIKNKWIVYRNDSNKVIQTYYYYPYGRDEPVEGTQGYGFIPDISNQGSDELDIFDMDTLQKIRLRKKTTQQYNDFDTVIYEYEDQILRLQPITGYPIVVTIGEPTEFVCASSINQLDCKAFLEQQENSYLLVEDVTGKVVKQELIMTVTTIPNSLLQYWLEVDANSILKDTQTLPQTGFIPLAQRTVFMQYDADNVKPSLFYSNPQMKLGFREVSTLHAHKKLYYILFLVLGIVFFLAFVGLLVFYCKKKNELEGDEFDQQANPIMNSEQGYSIPPQQYAGQ